MEQADYWTIADADIEIQNPVTDRKHRLLDDYCDIRDGLNILDVGCGKAWVLRQWAERFRIEATGIDTNPVFLSTARRKSPARGSLRFFQGRALKFEAAPESFDVVLCLGAADALGGFVEAVDWMVAKAKPGGNIVIGELTLKHRPAVFTHQHLPPEPIEFVNIIGRHGAEVSALISASDADFERYASHQRHATLRWAREHPDHPDHDDVLEKSEADWKHYLQVTRSQLGWTIFVARKAG